MLSRRAVLGASAMAVLSGQDRKPTMFGNAQAYEKFMGRWSRLAAPLLVDFSELGDAGRVLDVGSGTGSLAFAVAERKRRVRVVGIDPSKEYVAYASERSPFPDRIHFQTGDAQQLEFPDASFDASVSLLVFNFIPDSKKALSEVRRVTKAGGRVSAAVWDYGGEMLMLRTFWDAAVSLDSGAAKLDEGRRPLCQEGGLARLWRDGGLDDVREQPIVIRMEFQSFADYWDGFLLGQGPAGAYVVGLDPAKRQALRSEVMRRLPVTREDARLVLPARAFAVRGTVPRAR